MIYDYIVIILNYNSFEYLNVALESLRKYAIGSYKICIVDNNSSRENEREKLLELKADDVEILLLENNCGYGEGNNKAVSYMNTKYEAKYIVIMNPDIEITQLGTVEGVIRKAEENSAVGGQPLVWNYYYSDNPKTQINIGKTVGYGGLCIQSSLFFRLLFKKQFENIMFIKEMPYNEHIKYHMPSGAFFVIRKDVYEEINGFDSGTFLYGEESILAFKLNKCGYDLLLCPEYTVKHLQGATTGYDRYCWDIKRLNYIKQSRNVFAKKYLKCNTIQIWFLDMILNFDFVARKIYVMFNKKRKNA